MNFFTLKIPKEEVQTVTEIESWTVNWDVKTGWGDNTKRQSKVFINKDDAHEYRKQLEEAAKFLGCWVRTDLFKN